MIYNEKTEPFNKIQFSMDDCIHGGIMTDVLSKFRNEVFNMFLFEYDEELHLKSTYEEGREEERRTLLIKTLESKGNLPPHARTMILSEDNSHRLAEWFDLALVSQTIEEFLENLDDTK